MTLGRPALVSVTIGLGLALGGCSPPTSPTPPPPFTPTARVAVTVSSVTKAPEKSGYTFRLQLAESGGVPSTVTGVGCEFDGNLNSAYVPGDQLGQNRRLTANGTLDLELTCVPPWGYLVQHEEYGFLVVYLTDDNGHRVSAESSVVKL